MIKTDKYTIEQKFRPNPLPVEGLPLGLRGTGRYYVPHGHISPMRYSSYTAMGWCVSGCLSVFVDDMGVFNITPKHIGVITPNLNFRLEVISDECEFYYLAIDGNKAEDISLSAGLWTGVFPCRDVPFSRLQELSSLIESENSQDQATAASVACNLFSFQAELAKELIKDDLIYQAQWFFHRNWYDYTINVESVVRYLGVDRVALSKRFKRKTGISMLNYLTGLRICNAKKMLNKTDKSISEIAISCGYQDPSYFSRIFRKRCNTTPLQFRLGNESPEQISPNTTRQSQTAVLETVSNTAESPKF